MDPVARNLSSDIEYSSEAFIATLLHGKPEHQHLDVLTDLLTRVSDVDERVASSISAAWQWICQNDLWSTRYESLSDYRRAIGYTETVRPIVQRHKKSELAKRSSTQTIFRYWQVPFDEALPPNTRPLTWSKHLLSLIACLSKHRNHLDSLSLLDESMKNRPERGRNKNRLMASDVQRALETLGIPQARLAVRGSKKLRISSSSAQSTGAHNRTEVDPLSSTIQSEVLSRPNTLSQGMLSLDPSSPQGLQTNTNQNEWQCCGCIPICLPLIALISTPQARFDKRLLTALVDWAYTMSWGSFCSEHLTRLARFISGADSRGRTRADTIQKLESFCSRECYSSISDRPSISTPNLCSNTELLCRYTGSADAWWRWQRDGFLHVPGFFSYMEELGVFKRARRYLDRSGTKKDYNLTLSRNAIYSMISQMIQRDPAYYAVLVACRPDQHWNLIHRPGQHQQRTVFQNDDVGFGVPIDCIKSLVQGEGTSDIQSTVILPTCDTAQKIRLVPGFHRQLNSWLQSSLELKYGNAYKVFGEARDIVVQPGDLVICLPQILRWPTTFSSSNFLNLSQIGPDSRFSTITERLGAMYATNSSTQAWQLPEPHFHDAERTGDEYHAAKVCLTEDTWYSASSAIGQALTGDLDWGSDRASEERDCVLGSHGATAVELVAKSRGQLAKHFHKLCDSIEQGSEIDTDCGMDMWKERDDAPESFQDQHEYLETPESFINPLMSTSPTWNNPSLDDMVADLDDNFSQQPMSFNLP
ncbi:hypothetical protein N7517_010256 [Penicillium concentricum]|uniref:JmjC domain-containing protein n=1 Tax=Penicillium concentricum TaxID=293559 RepID=A0A9W9USF5_9EURO|nr:uncharacterized protein N7517_010256 [Penicillium concentricum]KAJ5355647.1 hypothetical protein N7517_010256 [Penicillium concentricum]